MTDTNLENRKRNRKRFLLVFVYALLLAPWVASGAMNALKTNANSPLDWVDADFAPRRDYDLFSEQFGAGDAVVISWPGCKIDEPKLDLFANALRQAPAFHDDTGWLFHNITSGRERFTSLTQPPMSVSREEATRRLTGSLIGPDGKTTCVVISFGANGLKQRSRLVPLIRATAARYCDAEHAAQHLAGPIMDGYAVDRASQTTMNRFAPLSSIIVCLVCLLCLDSLYAAMLVFGASCICQAIALAILHHSGGTMTALLIVLPPLIQVLAIAGGIHLVNYYFDAASSTRAAPKDSAIATALHVGWLPCLLSSATTAIGLGSLAVSGLAVVREFGIFAAIGILATVVILLVAVPGVIAWKPIRVPESFSRNRRSTLWPRLTDWQARYGTLTSGVVVLLIVGLGIGVSRLEASVRIETLFGSESRLIKDYAWLEKHVGGLVPIEAIVRFDEDCAATAGQRLRLLRAIENRMGKIPDVQSVTSCLDFMPTPPDSLRLGAVSKREPIALATGAAELNVKSRRPAASAVGSDKEKTYVSKQSLALAQAKPLVIASNYLAQPHAGGERWRITAHVTALGNTNYGSLLEEIRAALTSELPNDDHASLELSGLMSLVHEIQSQLLRDLFASFVTAFVLIAIVMTIVQAGLLSGLLSMVPNVFPALALFGLLGWMNHPIDIGSIMTASVAMGIAVDDTLHFLTFFQRRIDAGASRRESVQAAYEHCGRAMIQTTLICGAGLAIFAFSDFVPTARFAWMMVTLLAAALVGDLILLPALLLGPLGGFFDRSEGDADVLDSDLAFPWLYTPSVKADFEKRDSFGRRAG